MVDEIRLYFEGDRSLRRGFRNFLRSAIEQLRKKNFKFALIATGATPLDYFSRAIRQHSNAEIILLIDAEGPMEEQLNNRILEELKIFCVDNPSKQMNKIFFMVQIMETWFLADINALKDYYGENFNANKLPAYLNIEDAPKGDVLKGLKEASRNTKKGEYHKTQHAPYILERLDPLLVRKKAPACDKLFKKLQSFDC